MREYPVFIPCFYKDGAAVFTDVCVCVCRCVRLCLSLRAESTLFFFFSNQPDHRLFLITGGIFPDIPA